MTRNERRQLRQGLAFVAPWVIGFLVFMLYPICASFYNSLCDYSVLQPPVFIGLGNYQDLMADRTFWTALGNTLAYMAVFLPLSIVCSLVLALLLDSGIKGLPLYRAVFFLPTLVPGIAVGIIWAWMLNGDQGPVNQFLRTLGLSHPPPWLTDPHWSKPAMVLVSLWGIGQAVILYLAGLQDVPRSLYEAADLDGASIPQKIWYVTLPTLFPVIQFNLIIAIIGAFQFFAIPYVIAPYGEPARSLYFYVTYLYDAAFPYLRMGYACAMAWILFLITGALSILALRLLRRGDSTL